MKDTSLRADQAWTGTVIDVQVFTREGIEKDKRAQQIIDDELKRFRLDLNDQLRIVEADAFDRIEKLLAGKSANGGPRRRPEGHDRSTRPTWNPVEKYHWFDIRPATTTSLPPGAIKNARADQRHSFDLALTKAQEADQGDELPAPGVLKMVKVYLAVKRRLQPGDKMAGRHGNKGVVSKIVAVEDMPYWPTARRRHRAEPAGRAVAHERRPGAKCTSAGPARASASASATCCGEAGGRAAQDLRRFNSRQWPRTSSARVDEQTAGDGGEPGPAACRSRRRCSDGASEANPRHAEAGLSRTTWRQRASGHAHPGSRCTTAAPASRSSAGHRGATCTC